MESGESGLLWTLVLMGVDSDPGGVRPLGFLLSGALPHSKSLFIFSELWVQPKSHNLRKMQIHYCNDKLGKILLKIISNYTV